MQTASSITIDTHTRGASHAPSRMPGLAAALDHAEPSPVLVRWAGHMPYFLVGSALFLPERLSIGAAVVIALLYSVFGHFTSLWIKRRQPSGADRVGRIARAAVGSLGLVVLMSLVAPVIPTCMLGAAWGAPAGVALLDRYLQDGGLAIWAAYFAFLLPVALGFFAIQLVTWRSRDA